jgi:hypothetical protein
MNFNNIMKRLGWRPKHARNMMLDSDSGEMRKTIPPTKEELEVDDKKFLIEIQLHSARELQGQDLRRGKLAHQLQFIFCTA